MSSLQCPATMLVLPCSGLKEVDLGGLRIAHVWCDPESAVFAQPLATNLGLGVTVRDDVSGREALSDIADLHPGETVLVVGSDVTTATEVLVDADGWSRRPWPKDAADEQTAD